MVIGKSFYDGKDEDTLPSPPLGNKFEFIIDN